MVLHRLNSLINLLKGINNMKSISSLLIGSSLILFTTVGMAAGVTSLDTNWTCKTNASSSTVEADKAADKEMSEKTKSAADAFAFAAKNCRDCTEISCEVDD